MHKICLFFILLSQSLFGQEAFVFVTDSVKVEFVISNEGNQFVEDITVQNLSLENIYIPVVNKEFYFFTLNERLHSYLGIMSSITGAPNLGGQIELVRVEPKDTLKLTVKIDESRAVKFYSFGFDFMTEKNKSLIKFKDDKLWVYTSDYVDVHKGLYHKQN